MVSLISLLLYKQIGFSDTKTILVTSLFMLPWSLKLLIVPFLENQQIPKKLIVNLQMVSAFLFLILALATNQTYFAPLSIVVFSVLALVSSTHDIVADALYLTELDLNTQKIYIGIRTIFYQIGILFVKGGLLMILPALAVYFQINNWRLLFLSLSGVVFFLTIYHYYQLPYNETKTPHTVPIKHLIQNLYRFGKKHCLALFFIFFYNISSAPMQKIIPLFLIDPQGANLSLAQVGSVYGLWSTAFFMLGIFISGHFISRYSLSHSLIWFTVLLTLGHGLFIGVAFCKSSTVFLYLALIISQFITGLANGTYMGYLLSFSHKSEHPMSIYTLGTSLMTFSWIFFGVFSGILLPFINYELFFIVIFILNLLLMRVVFLMVNFYE